jgi:TolB-like protein
LVAPVSAGELIQVFSLPSVALAKVEGPCRRATAPVANRGRRRPALQFVFPLFAVHKKIQPPESRRVMRLRSFLRELKRRNVFRAAILYMGGVWALAQGISQLGPSLGAPDWATRWFLVAAGIGFPFWIAFSWFYEFTPEGLKRESEIDRAESIPRHTGRKLDFAIIGVLTIAVVLLLTDRFVLRHGVNESTARPILEKSIAVLPFENLSDDKANAYFVAGMQDEILTALAKISALKVISKTSTEKYSSRPGSLKAIAQELGVTAILEGSVQRASDVVHINLQLINGRDDTHLWAESYDRELKKVFEVEREVAETVAGKLKAQLSPQDTKELSRVPTTNPEAYDRYLKGLYAKNECLAGRLDSLQPAIDFFKEAVALDPHFALAYARLADTELYAYDFERAPPLKADSQTHLAKALELEPDLFEAHMLQAGVYWYVNHDSARALAEIEPLLARAPNDARVFIMLGYIKGALGDWQGHLAAIQRAIELDPRNTGYLQDLALSYSNLRRYREAIETLSRVRALEPENWVARMNLAGLLVLTDRMAEAQAELQQWPDAKLQSLVLAAKYSCLQEIETFSRNYDAAIALASKIPDLPNRLPTNSVPVGNIRKNGDLGFLYLYKGDRASAEKAFTAARDELEGQRAAHADGPDFYANECFILAGLGKHAEAVKAAREATSKQDNYMSSLAQVYAHFGDADEAFGAIQKMIDKPGDWGLTAALLRRDPIWDPIRKDPRFEKAITSLAAKELN